jgi:hypothetical protein
MKDEEKVENEAGTPMEQDGGYSLTLTHSSRILGTPPEQQFDEEIKIDEVIKEVTERVISKVENSSTPMDVSLPPPEEAMLPDSCDLPPMEAEPVTE